MNRRNCLPLLISLISSLLLQHSLICSESVISSPDGVRRQAFTPLSANIFEGRIGMRSRIGDNSLRLDIGNSIDLLQQTDTVTRMEWSVGTDFFTFTSLKGEERFHFPVDAVDYLFGVNGSFRYPLDALLLESRLRLSHISAHFVDGHYDGTQRIWKGSDPRVYSREFLDLVVAARCEKVISTRAYIGSLYVYNVHPDNLCGLSPYAGCEIGLYSTQWVQTYTAYQIELVNIGSAAVRHSLQIGGVLKTSVGGGIDLFVNFHSGPNIHGEYFDRIETATSIGFAVHY